MKCPTCRKKLKKGGQHIYYCSDLEDKKEIKFNYIKFNFPKISSKSILFNEYVNNLLSLPDLKIKYGINSEQILFLLQYWGIPKRTLSESAKKISSKKYKETCRKKYGVDNVSQLDLIKEQKKETFLENYYVDNIFKNEEFKRVLPLIMYDKYGQGSVPNINGNANPFNIKGISDEEKTNRLNKAHEGYRKYWDNLPDDEKNELIKKRCVKVVSNYNSKLETRISKILSANLVLHKRQFWVNRKSYDFRFWNTNFLLEVQGDFWHANPQIYKPDDILNHPFKKVTASSLWRKDRKKKENAEKNGYKLIYLWETDINVMSDEDILYYIKKMIKTN